ncbi:GATOR complex protein NPRL3 isoform X1 [Schistocerca americana]|uniref:GATOR complex protein NPRL3 isoform X1 n=1 Tax=Schistocerca americana TaxID=7009 RepID=UPI001F4F2543|nr:GATOR complex protein NPRL3 isoform X1 [Schistocerca americana]
MEPDPLSVILVKSDSKGDRLLFRYPYANDLRTESGHQKRRKNPYALVVTEDLLQSPPPQTSNISKGRLTGFSDEVLSTLFAVKPELCERKFELKVNDVRFVGHPTLMPSVHGGKRDNSSVILINIVFALRATASHSIVKCYYDLSKRLGVALRHEEKRCGYVSQENRIMVTAHDEVASRPEEDRDRGSHLDDTECPFELIVQRSALARKLRSVYEDLSTTGLVQIRINNWIEVSFCLPQKVHQCHCRGIVLEPESIKRYLEFEERCLQSLKPYHGLLLLVEPSELLETLSPDSSPALVRLVQIYSPIKSLQTLAADADLTLRQVFQLTGHLVYWAKATVIFPLCENNVYVVSPDAPTGINSPLVERFSESFPGLNLLQVMSDFSLPTPLGQKKNPLHHPQQQSQLVKVVVWLLQHKMLLQLHTYVYFMPTARGPPLRNQAGSSSGGGGGSFRGTPDESDLSSTVSDEGIGSLVPDLLAPVVDQPPFAELTDDERAAVLRCPAAANPEDLRLLARLCRAGYLRGEHHLEEIMYQENLRRSTLLQLLDKFRDVLVTCDTEDPDIAVFHTHTDSPGIC